MKKLKDIIDCDFDVEITGINEDSRDIKPGYLFVATKGFNVDHFDYIDSAIENGAVALVTDREYDTDLPVVIVDDINSTYLELCKKFYDVKLDDLSLIGITGTDGKTTSATIIQKVLNDSMKCACLGTNGLSIDDEVYHTNNTTPCISELYSSLSIVENNNCKALVMEVSSEALLHGRVKELKYDIVAITNITEDHLNVHKTIENYRECKLSIVNYLKDDGIVIVNGDDEICKSLHANNLITFGFNEDNDFVIFDYEEDRNGLKFKVRNNDNVYDINSSLFGKYNAYNICLGFIIGLCKKIPVDDLIKTLVNINFVAGRGEVLRFGQDYDIILDYAHTYNSINNLLNSVKGKYKRIITVTGAAGGREKEKRSKIGDLVLNKSDIVVFTMDDPRYEDVNSIIDDMIGDSTKTNYIREVDRVKAIYKAFDMAEEGDVVLVIGKGRDDYMAFAEGKVPYCDYDVICDYFK